MIRAIVRNGLLQPLDPLPKDWVEGMEIELDGNLVTQAELGEIDERWARLEQIYQNEEDDPEDWKRVQEVIADQKRADVAIQRKKAGIE